VRLAWPSWAPGRRAGGVPRPPFAARSVTPYGPLFSIACGHAAVRYIMLHRIWFGSLNFPSTPSRSWRRQSRDQGPRLDSRYRRLTRVDRGGLVRMTISQFHVSVFTMTYRPVAHRRCTVPLGPGGLNDTLSYLNNVYVTYNYYNIVVVLSHLVQIAREPCGVATVGLGTVGEWER